MIATRKLPPLIAVIAVAIIGGFYLGGPGLGMAVGALAAGSIVVVAIRNPPGGRSGRPRFRTFVGIC